MSLNSTFSQSILHIVTDEKFIDAAFYLYEEAFPKMNTFLIYHCDNNDEIVHIKNIPFENIIIRNCIEKEVLKDTVMKYDIIVFHGFKYDYLEILKYSDQKYNILSVFGFEIYKNSYLWTRKIKSLKTIYYEIGFTGLVKNEIKSFYHKIKGIKKNIHNLEIANNFKKIDAIASLYYEEFDEISDIGYFQPDLDYIFFTYYPINYIFKNTDTVLGDNFLVGNSADPCNNHVNSLCKIYRSDLYIKSKYSKVIVPLSYGGDKKYIKSVIELGNKLFGDRFIPLQKFLPLSEYQNILETCSYVVMNHYRQQAVGNILNSLHMGATVYMNNRSSFYRFLKNKKLPVYDINDLDNSKDELNEFNSREVLKNMISGDKVVKSLRSNLRIA